MDIYRLPASLWHINHVGNKAKDNHQKTSWLLMGPEQVTRPKSCKLYDDDIVFQNVQTQRPVSLR